MKVAVGLVRFNKGCWVFFYTWPGCKAKIVCFLFLFYILWK
jgi:hypothetical protein